MLSAALVLTATSAAVFWHQPWRWPFLIGVAAGVMAYVVGSRTPVIAWLERYRYLTLAAAVGLALLLLFAGDGPAGTATRIRLWGMQPVELIKLLVIAFIASYLSVRDRELTAINAGRTAWLSVPRLRDVLPVVGAVGSALVLFILQKDLGPALVLYLTFLVMFVVATRRVGLAITGLGALIGAWWGVHRAGLIPTVSTRIEMWRSPWDTTSAGGSQLAESLWALASGGRTGLGAAGATPGYVPAGHTDLVLAQAGEVFGVGGVLLPLVALLVLVTITTRHALRACHPFHAYLAVGIATYLGIQTSIIAAGTLGLMPLTGVPVPFMSYGKAAMVVQFLALGLVAAIARRQTGMVATPSAWRMVPVMLLASVFLVIGWRAWQLMVLDADAVLIRPARVLQADGERRDVHNRRLLDLIRALPRGRILARDGEVLAEDDPATSRRVYPLGPAAAQLVGHSRAVWADPRTMERMHEDTLRGFDPGDFSVLVAPFRDRRERAVLEAKVKDVRMALDATMQRLLFNALQSNLPTLDGVPRTHAAGVVLNSATGEVLAAVSLPSYDPNAITARELSVMFDAGTQAALDRVRFGRYAPGSTFKLVTALAALSGGVQEAYRCDHRGEVAWEHAGRAYRRSVVDDAGSAAHGMLTMDLALAVSCNVYFARLAATVGADALLQMARHELGLSVRDIRDAYAMAMHLADHSYGQALVTTTPLEMAGVAATIVNGGRRVPPVFLVDDVGHVPATVVIAPSSALQLKAWMVETVSTGTGQRAKVDGWVVGGKTGTAETTSGDGAPHSWFVGFATPGAEAATPLAFAVIIEHGGYGGRAAAAAVSSFLKSVGTSHEKPVARD